jgi:uncharacterized membrane protein
MLNELFWVIVLSMSPISELRGGIPVGLALGLPPEAVILTAFLANAFVFFPVYFGLDLFYHRFFERFAWARKLMEGVHKRGAKSIEKYGVLGLAIFIGIPLPATGVWTGTGVAWLLGLDWKKSFVAAVLGVAIATAIVSAVVLGVINIAGLV